MFKTENESKSLLNQEKSNSADSRYKLHNTMNGLLAKMNHLNDTAVEVFDSKIRDIDEHIGKWRNQSLNFWCLLKL